MNEDNFSKEIITINNGIKNFIYNKNELPFYNYEDLPTNLNYNYYTEKMFPNCHLGQRKLLLTEIEFYNKCVDFSNNYNLIIYAGSASCEHLPVILKLFPTLKFILIDPFYHSIDADFEYIYQNIEVVGKYNHQHFMKQLSNKNMDDRDRHLKKTTEKLLKVSFACNSNKDKKYNVLDIDDKKHIEDMKRFMNSFNEDRMNIIDYIFNSNKRVFIIQDYMTIKLTELLKNYIYKISTQKPDIYFLTDIRTVLYGDLGASDIDILWNSALQIIFLKGLGPKFSMLKFRTPFFINQNKVKQIAEDNSGKYDFIKNDLNFVKINYKIDLLKNYLQNKFLYFKKDFIYVQPWAPSNSAESRLFVSRENIDANFIEYSSVEWENKFYFFNIIRFFKFFPLFYEKIKDVKGLFYDGCQDCAREIMIITDYILNNSNNNNNKNNKKNNFGYNLEVLANALENKNVQDKLREIYELENKFLFYDLYKKNYKCKHHGYMDSQRNYIKFMYNQKIIKVFKDNKIFIEK